MYSFVKQGIFEVKDGKPVLHGYEVLTRHPTLSPPAFLATLNSDELQQHFLDVIKFANNIPGDCPVFINSVPENLETEESRECLKEVTRRRKIIVEVSETKKYDYSPLLRITSHAIDDFPHAHAMENLFGLAPEYVKLALHFTQNYIEAWPLKGLLEQLGHAYKIVAEGVETKKQFDACARCGFLVQGFLLEKPN